MLSIIDAYLVLQFLALLYYFWQKDNKFLLANAFLLGLYALSWLLIGIGQILWLYNEGIWWEHYAFYIRFFDEQLLFIWILNLASLLLAVLNLFRSFRKKAFFQIFVVLLLGVSNYISLVKYFFAWAVNEISSETVVFPGEGPIYYFTFSFFDIIPFWLCLTLGTSMSALMVAFDLLPEHKADKR